MLQIVIAVQAFFNVSPYPLWTSLIPLAFILGTSATKEAYEDMVASLHRPLVSFALKDCV